MSSSFTQDSEILYMMKNGPMLREEAHQMAYDMMLQSSMDESGVTVLGNRPSNGSAASRSDKKTEQRITFDASRVLKFTAYVLKDVSERGGAKAESSPADVSITREPVKDQSEQSEQTEQSADITPTKAPFELAGTRRTHAGSGAMN